MYYKHKIFRFTQIFNSPFTQQEDTLILYTESSICPRLDDISYATLQYLPPEVSSHLLSLLNNLWKLNIIPEE